MHILRRRHYEFVPATLAPGRFPLVIKGKFDTSGGTEYPTWKLTLTTTPGAYGKKDIEEPYELKDEAPEIVLYAAQNYNGDKMRSGDKFTAKVQRGNSYIKWQEFCRILTACGIDPTVEGDCQPIDKAVGIKSIYLDVHPKEAYGDYPAKNWASDWSVSPEVFEAKRLARISGLAEGMKGAVSGADKAPGIDLDSADGDEPCTVSKRRMVDLSDAEPAPATSPGTAAKDVATTGQGKASKK